MADVALGAVLVVLLVIGLGLIPFGLPGLWVMVAGILVYGLMTGMRSLQLGTIGAVVGLAIAGEVAEWWLGFKLAQRYGASRRAGWGALVGGLAGAVIGLPVPLIGSVIGAFAGAFAGAAVLEFTIAGRPAASARAGWGAVLGRAAAAAVKMAIGVVIAVMGVFAVWQ